MLVIKHTRGYYGLYAWVGKAMKLDLSNQAAVALVSIRLFCCCYLLVTLQVNVQSTLGHVILR